MTQGTSQAAGAASVRPARHVAYTDHGDIVVRVPATLLELAAAVAVLVGLAAVPAVAAAAVPTVAALPLALVGLSAVLAGALFAPFVALALLVARLG